MMLPSRLEHWVLSVLDRLVKREQIEDIRVEVKTAWPVETSKAARRIAAHANAAGGEPILWIIGADEKSGVITGARREELADWWVQVQAQFDAMSPDLVDLIVPTENGSVVALLFDTSRAPFVVKNPGGGTVQLEVPWRDGTRVRSARRSDLIRMLVPLQQLPEVEIHKAHLTAGTENATNNESALNWYLWLELYLVPLSQERIVIPFHQCKAIVTVPGYLPERTVDVTLRPGAEGRLGQEPIRSLTIGGGNTELLIEGPGSASLSAYFRTEIISAQPPRNALVRVTLPPRA